MLAPRFRSEETIRELLRFRNSFNSAFESIAMALPEFSDNLQAIIHVAASLETTGLGETLQEIHSMVEALEGSIEEFRAQTEQQRSQFEQKIERVLQHIQEILPSIRKTRSYAQSTRLIGLNASISAAHLGNEGRAFDAITGALIKISIANSGTVDKIIEVTDSINSKLETLNQFRDALDDFRKEFDQGFTQTQLELNGIIESFDHIVRNTKETGSLCQDVHENIRKMMLEIHRQDTLRQGLQHIDLICQETTRDSELIEDGVEQINDEKMLEDVIEKASFQILASRLCTELFEQIISDVKKLIEHTEVNLNSVFEIGNLLSNKEPSTNKQNRAEVFQHTQNLRDEIESRSCLSLTNDHSEILRTVDTLIDRLSSILNEFRENTSELRMCTFMMKVEIAHVSNQNEAQTVAGMIEDVDRQLLTFDSELKNMELLVKHISDDIGSSKTAIHDISTHQNKHCHNTQKRFRDILSKLSNLSSVYEESTHKTSTAGKTLSETAAVLQHELDVLKSQLENHTEILEGCQYDWENSRELLDRASVLKGHAIIPQCKTPKFVKLLEDFTILSNAMTGHARLGQQSSIVDDDGELTLL